MSRLKLFADVPERTRKTMRAIRSSDTKPELQLRSLLHRAGLRFRKNVKTLPGSPDIVFASRRLAVFVHGCFWHQHPGCKHAKLPRVREEYWLPKLMRVTERDRENREKLDSLGWRSMVVWECELQSHPAATAQGVAKMLLENDDNDDVRSNNVGNVIDTTNPG